MGKKTFSGKIPGGKHLKISLDEKDGVIVSISIRGDFFIHPEECIEDIERSLQGVRLSYDDVIRNLRESTVLNDITILGFDLESIARFITEKES
jgi:lipoate---protein ligase